MSGEIRKVIVIGSGSCTPPLGSPWDAVQVAAQAWVAEHITRKDHA